MCGCRGNDITFAAVHTCGHKRMHAQLKQQRAHDQAAADTEQA